MAGARVALAAPLALSLAGHAVAIGLLAAGLRSGGAPSAAGEAIPVQRVEASPAVRLTVAGPGEETAGAVALDTEDRRYQPYLSGVRRRIREHWGAPALAPGQPARGSLVVEFTLTRSGRVASSGVLAPSGIPALDRAALEAVAGATPFTPLPASISGETFRVRARFTYD